ncbi:hypothetical protein HS088_TW13G00504 [Tripterygium wilfordii]|uniref:Cytochrome P450 n=1 Tax=Tripterygium wilfordii TaxID=458696 RepID=A0A7J7CU44_TRIWF|nr:hypothetical protein HS088_TW13G00504 [Tripterygium wilfordii]
MELLLCFLAVPFLFLLSLYLINASKPNTKTGFRTYPIVGAMPDFLKNRSRFLDWTTEVLAISPNTTAVLYRPSRIHGVLTANPDVVEYILKTNFENYPKGEKRFIIFLKDFLGHGIFNSDGDLWKFQRKTAVHEFNTRSLRNFSVENARIEIFTRLIPMIAKAGETGQVLDLQDMLERFAFDSICKLAFNVDPGCLGGDGTAGSEFMHAFEDAAQISSGRFMYPFPILWKFKRFINWGSERSLRNSIKIVHDFADEIIRSRLEQRNEERKDEDLLSRFIVDNENSPEFLRDVVISFILAGRDTTSSALTWFFWLLASNKDVEENILNELETIRKRYGKNIGDTYNYDAIRDMHYLHAAISESMSTSRSKATPKTGFKNYPIVGVLPEFVRNRFRYLDWTTEVLIDCPNNTAFFKRPGKVHGVITASPAVVEHFLKTQFENYPKGDRFIMLLEDFLGRGIFNSDGDLWKIQRKTAVHEFTTNSLRNFVMENVKVEISTRLVPIFAKAGETGQVLDLQDMLERFAFDNICKLAFNVDPACLGGDGTAGGEFMRAFEDAAMLSSGRFMYVFPLLYKFKKFFNLGSERTLRNSIRIVHEFADEIIRSRMEERSEKKDEDLLSRFVVSNENSPNFLRDIIISFILAGRDTTSSALSWFFWLLASNKDVEEKIWNELEMIRERYGKNIGDTYSFDELRDMQYLHAAISESMRLYPPVPMKSIAASIIERFEMDVQDKDKCPEHLLSLTLRMKGGLHVRVKERFVATANY